MLITVLWLIISSLSPLVSGIKQCEGVVCFHLVLSCCEVFLLHNPALCAESTHGLSQAFFTF